MKHVEFYSKNKFEELVHLVGFIISIFHDARPPECHLHKGGLNDAKHVRAAHDCKFMYQMCIHRRCE